MNFKIFFRTGLSGLLLIFSLQSAAWAQAVFHVPAMTLQEAVDAALDPIAGGDAAHEIQLDEWLYTTNARVAIAAAPIGWTHWKLVIRPNPNLSRATIASSNGSQTIFSIGPNARDITFQDLDVIRHSTNRADLIEISHGIRITFDRCRIGSNWTSVGSKGWTMLTMTYPMDILVRNCIFFSYMAGNFDRGIKAVYGDKTNSLRLYNNVVADYRVAGIDISSAHPQSLILLRNNIVLNRPSLAPEPVAYQSNVGANVAVVSSHNVAFASVAGRVEAHGVQLISGLQAMVVLGPGAANTAFMDTSWNTAPAWDANRQFYRLKADGALHDSQSRWGVTVLNGAPHGADIAVTNDIELNNRPSGNRAHTDRGADQIKH